MVRRVEQMLDVLHQIGDVDGSRTVVVDHAANQFFAFAFVELLHGAEGFVQLCLQVTILQGDGLVQLRTKEENEEIRCLQIGRRRRRCGQRTVLMLEVLIEIHR